MSLGCAIGVGRASSVSGASERISRRRFLRGAGALLAVPFLQSAWPRRLLAAPEEGATAPQRLAFIFVPNGKHMAAWTPSEVGALTELPPILAPLAAFKQRLNVLSGLAIDGGRAHGDGPGDHARAAASFLTCAHPKKTGGADLRAGISVDQVAARALANQTRFPSLELGGEGGALTGECDSGYSCAYSSSISWRSESVPAPKETSPRRLLERLFAAPGDGLSANARARRLIERRSLLDALLADARRMKSEISAPDRDKLEEYLNSLREIETRIEVSDERRRADLELARARGIEPGAEDPRDYDDRIRALMDLTALAFASDATRVVSLMIANAGSGRSYPDIGVPEAHHGLSHHGGDVHKQEQIQKINTHHTGLLAHLLERMAATKEGEGTLLDNVALVYASGIGDGNRHNHDDLPVLLVGGGGGGGGAHIEGGRHLRFAPQTPMANLYLRLLQTTGIKHESFADSDGALAL